MPELPDDPLVPELPELPELPEVPENAKSRNTSSPDVNEPSLMRVDALIRKVNGDVVSFAELITPPPIKSPSLFIITRKSPALNSLRRSETSPT